MPEKTIQLPATFLGDNREFHMGFSFHGDIQLGVREGKEAVKRFGLAHTHETLLVAACLGYYARLGIDRLSIQLAFSEITKKLLDEIPRSSALSQDTFMEDVVDGGYLPQSFDVSENLRCLALPTPVCPGTTEKMPSTGIYTRLHENGSQILVLASLPPHKHNEQITLDQITTAEFCRDDVLPIARVICDLAMGDSRHDIAALLYEFSDKSDSSN